MELWFKRFLKSTVRLLFVDTLILRARWKNYAYEGEGIKSSNKLGIKQSRVLNRSLEPWPYPLYVITHHQRYKSTDTDMPCVDVREQATYLALS